MIAAPANPFLKMSDLQISESLDQSLIALDHCRHTLYRIADVTPLREINREIYSSIDAISAEFAKLTALAAANRPPESPRETAENPPMPGSEFRGRGYDFVLHFRHDRAPQMGAKISSGMTDDRGRIIHFAGSGYVVNRAECAAAEETAVYVRIHSDQ